MDRIARPYPVRVMWHDSATVVSSWAGREEVLRGAQQPYHIETVGLLVAEDTRRILVALSHDNQVPEPLLHHAIMIPKTAILSRKRLK